VSLLALVIVFGISSLFWAWIIFLGGADWLEGSFISAFLISVHAPQWTAEEMKAFVGLIWFFEGIWFVVGLFVPGARFMW
jgi:hypothetical protein